MQLDASTLAVLTVVGGMIAGVTGLVKYAVPRELQKWETLLIVGGTASVALILAEISGELENTNLFSLSAAWLQLVLAAIGVREVATVPAVQGKTLSDLPSR